MKKLSLLLIFFIMFSSIAFYYFKKSENLEKNNTELKNEISAIREDFESSKKQLESIRRNPLPETVASSSGSKTMINKADFKPVITKIIFSSDYLLELRILFDYAKYLGVFEKNGVYLEGGNYYLSKNTDNGAEDKKADLEIRFGIISDFFGEYYSGKDVSWIANVTKGIQGFGVSAYPQKDFSQILNVGIIPFSKDKEFIGKVLLKSFGINNGNMFRFEAASYDKDREDKLKDKEIDFTYFKGKKEILSKSYNIIEPIKTGNYYHYRVAYMDDSYLNKKKEISAFRKALKEAIDKLKQDEGLFYIFMEDQYKRGSMAKDLIDNKVGFYKDLKRSVEGLSFDPDADEVKNVLEIYKETNSNLKFDRKLEDSIR